MTGFVRDIRYAFRVLARTPGLSAAAILTVALGVGLTTHTFSIVYGSVVRGIPYEGADRLVSISQGIPADGTTGRDVPLHDFLDWRDQQTRFESLAAQDMLTVNLADDTRRPDRFLGSAVTWNVLQQSGAAPFLGRVFREGEDLPGAEPTLVLGYDVWENRYGADPAIVGQPIRANGVLHTVIGVMPPKFQYPFDSHVWLPLAMDPLTLERGQGSYLEVYGKLLPGVTNEQALSELQTISSRLATEYPETNAGVVPEILPLTERYMPSQITAAMWVMLAAVFGVLLIACSNVANLLLARAATRGKEVAVRTALGASRGAVIRQLLIEAMVLATFGGVLGLGLSAVGIRLFNASIVDIQKPFWIDIAIFPAVLAFSIIVTLVASVVAGTIPAIKASGAGVNELLKDASRGSSIRMGRLSGALVIGEVALSFGLLIAAGLMVKSVLNVSTIDLGFDTEQVLTARVSLSDVDYPEKQDWTQFHDSLVERLEALPAVESVALTSSLPMDGAGMFWYGVEGEAYATEQDYPFANSSVVSLEFFETFGARVIRGRKFAPTDVDESPRTVIVNESFARRHFRDTGALGRRIRYGRGDDEQPWREIVGVVPDLRIGGGVGGIGSDDRIQEQIYVPLMQSPQQGFSIALRTQGDPLALAPALRDTVSGIDANLPLYDVASMDGVIKKNTWAFGLFGSLFAMFGVIALFMSAVGLYGVMAFSVNRRRNEMGIRMAIGARAGDIAGLVFRKAFVQLGIGIAIGLALGVGLAMPLRVMMFDVNVFDPVVYGGIALVLVLTGSAACFVPARRATRVDIVDVLRPE